LFKPLLGYVSILVFVTIDFFQRVLVNWWNAYEYKEFAGDSPEFKCAACSFHHNENFHSGETGSIYFLSLQMFVLVNMRKSQSINCRT
jgi:hypothetical protein